MRCHVIIFRRLHKLATSSLNGREGRDGYGVPDIFAVHDTNNLLLHRPVIPQVLTVSVNTSQTTFSLN